MSYFLFPWQPESKKIWPETDCTPGCISSHPDQVVELFKMRFKNKMGATQDIKELLSLWFTMIVYKKRKRSNEVVFK